MPSCLPRPAFTLLELLITVAIIALLAGAATLSFSKPIARAQLSEAVTQLRYLDATARQAARNGQTVELHFDLETATLSRRERRETRFSTTLASNITLAEIRTPGRRNEFGQLSLPISSLGLSDSYAVKFTTASEEKWLLVAGLSGQIQLARDGAAVDAFFAE